MNTQELKETLMEMVCDRCHYPYEIEDQEVMNDLCDACPLDLLGQMIPAGEIQVEIQVPDEIRALMGGETA